ncbi:hypothetical protein Clacol_004774 [Clathrus columnatus]|uniref:Bin3-type SAM domain-containing protein n=1 Tax=Clathrus columnatus TaxID=1419009 RepID=A0AAV5A7E8_9AGAM|nr:hypothetical protein Clacol_004774 [Clathrus columnatus]
MSMDVEEMIRAQPMDSVILIGGCDKTVPAELMGAISANKPAVQLVTGPMLTSTYVPIDQNQPEPQTPIIPNRRGERIGACTDCRRLWTNYRAGEIDIEELGRVNEMLVPGPGTCSVMGTASTMACIAEALGMAPLGSSAPPAVSAARQRVAETVGRVGARLAGAGDRLVQVGVGIKPTDVLRRENFENAVTVLQAIGGSTNAIIHLLAIAGRVPGAREGMINLTLDDVDIIGRRTPLILDLKPSGMGFHNEGGLPALLRVLRPLLHLNAMTVTGRTLGEELDLYQPTPQPNFLIRPLFNPVFPCASLIILKGNLAPNGAVLKQSAASSKYTQQEVVGEAIVFDGVEDMTEKIDDPNLDVNEESVLVLRGIGLLGRGRLGEGKGKGKDAGLGMPESGLIPIPKKLARRGVKDILRISDGRMSGTAFGSVVLHVSPEGGGGHDSSDPELLPLLGLIKTGDRVRLDVPNRVIEVLLSPEEIEKRKGAWVRTWQQQEENTNQKMKVRQKARGYYQSKRPTTATLDARLSLVFQGAVGDAFLNAKCILDVGCNEGWVTCEIAQRFNPQHITGVDIDPELVRSAWKRRRTVWSLQRPWSLPLPSSVNGVDISREKEISQLRKRRRITQAEEQPQMDDKPDTNRFDFEYFPFAMEHMFGPILIPTYERNSPFTFPHNITFRTADWVSRDIPEDKEGYDIVLAFSISKWIHLNKGDNGLKLFFQKVFDVLKPGGSFIIEPQPWNSYAKARRTDGVRIAVAKCHLMSISPIIK